VALDQALVEAELAQRFKSALGTFTSTADLLRLRMAILDALRVIWTAKEWRFKNKTATLVTDSATGKGPYTAPTDLYKLAMRLDIYRFGYDDQQILAPVKDSATASYFLWIDVETGDLFFKSAPGDATLTLNYQATLDQDPANLANTLAQFPESVMKPLYHFVKANMYEDLPQFEALADPAYQKGVRELEVVWQDYSQGQVRQRQMAPRGLTGMPIDGLADPMSIRGPQPWQQRRDP
jgi:hypothetical protein